MSCPINIEQWRRDNRVRLYPGKVNRWVLARTLRDNPSNAELHQTLIAVMGKWFSDSGIGILTDSAGSTVDSIQIESTSTTRPILPSAQRKEKLPQPPLLVGGGIIYLTVTFNYRGVIESMPWPVWSQKFSLLKEGRLCPIDCDWMLVEAATDAEGHAEALPEAGQELPWWGREVSKYSAGSVLVDTAKTAITLVKLAAVAAGAYLAWSIYSTTRGVRSIAGASKRASRLIVNDDEAP